MNGEYIDRGKDIDYNDDMSVKDDEANFVLFEEESK